MFVKICWTRDFSGGPVVKEGAVGLIPGLGTKHDPQNYWTLLKKGVFYCM